MEERSIEALRDAVIFETAWLCRTLKGNEGKKDELLEFVKVVWNRAVQRAGLHSDLPGLDFDEKDIRKAADYFARANVLPSLTADATRERIQDSQ